MVLQPKTTISCYLLVFKRSLEHLENKTIGDRQEQKYKRARGN